jgi:PelA/Pel-15E family pectate lyase
MNDGGTLNYLKILGYILDNVSQLLDTTTLEKLIICQQKAFNLIKQLQIKINGIPTIWAMQYDPITLLPTYARTFEPACLGSLESCQLLIYLKEINFTYNNIFDIELQQSYNYGVSWFSNNAITNIIQTTTYDNTNTPIILYTYNTDNIPCRLWARMININTLKPIYTDRQGIQYDDINLLDVERKLGYTWLGNWGEYLLYI